MLSCYALRRASTFPFSPARKKAHWFFVLFSSIHCFVVSSSALDVFERFYQLDAAMYYKFRNNCFLTVYLWISIFVLGVWLCMRILVHLPISIKVCCDILFVESIFIHQKIKANWRWQPRGHTFNNHRRHRQRLHRRTHLAIVFR